ncbi:MAG TPA: efflux RND transporter periplasmic adaptor subunit [Gemmataceae bacterium]|jgi:multidrug resistance efflux pump|nr:efflux RND transporter periplasmic adaptor subunit [Gemmataceae bacterium]
MGAEKRPPMKRLVTALLIVGVLAVAGGAAWFFGPFRSHRGTLVLAGTVEIQEIRLGSKIGGRVKSVSVREGERVYAGQELVRFETPELDTQRDQLKAKLQAAEADLLKARRGPRSEEKAEAKAAVASAEANYERLKNGWREEEVRQAKNEAEAADADLIQANSEFERVDRLSKTGGGAAVTKSEWDLAKGLRDRAQKRYNAATAHYDMMKNGSRPEDVAAAAADLAKAKAHSEMLENGTRPEDIALAEANVAEIKGRLAEVEDNRKEAIVVAPGPAVIDVLAVRTGDLVPPNQPVLRILRDDDLWIKVFVPETELGKVRLGQQCEATVDAYPGKRLQGVVDQISSVSEFTPRNVQSIDERKHQVFALKVKVDNHEGVFKSGMAAEVTIPLAGGP